MDIAVPGFGVARHDAERDQVTLGGHQMRRGGPGAADHGQEVQIQQLLKIFGSRGEDFSPRRAAGAVHQHVQPAEAAERLSDQRLDVFLPRNVRGHA